METMDCRSLDEVRAQIDLLDRRIVALLAERGAYVRQAARYKRDQAEVEAPQRVAAVIARVRALAAESGADERVVEAVYRAMISAFIEAELSEHSRLRQGNGQVAGGGG
ncbi:chorismate mutase [Metapseudomonas resinovorans]|uniref:chorismate mutase n=1 Tax=Metapseudomonas resinovorans TaxID=53412 RepID=UPI0004218156